MFLRKLLSVWIQANILITLLQTATTPPTWVGTNMIQAGTIVIVQSSTHQEAGNIYVYTYSPAFTATPYTALGIISYQLQNLQNPDLKYLVNLQDISSTTQLKIKMEHPSFTPWKTFKVSYIAIDDDFVSVKVDYFSVTNPTNVNSGFGERVYTGTQNFNIGSVDVTHQISIIPFLVGIICNSADGKHDVKWSTQLNDASSIIYEIKVRGSTVVTQLISYILVVDRTQIAFDQEEYLDELYVTGVENSPNNEALIYNNVNNMHAGLNSFTFDQNAFDLVKTTLALTTTGYYKYISFSVLAYRKRDCGDPSMPYYQTDTNLCYDDCPTGYVNTEGTSMKYCPPCNNFIFGCKQCAADGSTCSLAYGNYVIVEPANTTCECPSQGFYESSDPDHSHPSDKCRECHESCKTCTGETSTSCATCKELSTLQGDFSCLCDHGTKLNGECSGMCTGQGCERCDADVDVCQVCESSFTLSSSECVCDPGKYVDATPVCANCHYSCETCSGGPNADQCESCDEQVDKRWFQSNTCMCIINHGEVNMVCTIQQQTSCPQTGYQLDPTLRLCVETCGDGLLIDYECDDGNTNNGDGCSSKCKVESGYVCTDNTLTPTQRSYCSFKGELLFKLIETTKWIYQNKINLTFRLTPALDHVFSVNDELTSAFIFTPEDYKLTTTSAKYDLKTQHFNVHLKYGQSIHKKDIELTFIPPTTAQTFAITESKYKLSVSPSNHLAAFYYDDQVYSGVSVGRALTITIAIIALLLATALLFYRKMLGLELVTMLQIIFFAGILTDYSHPFMVPTNELKYLNGYNEINIGDTSQKIDNDFQALGYYSSFFSNYNFMMFLSLGIYICALILFILPLITCKRFRKQLKYTSQFLVNEIGMGLMIFSLNNFIVSFVLEIVSGSIYPWSRLFFCIVGIVFIVHIVYFVYKVHDVRDSQVFYHPDKKYTHYYPLVLITKNLIIVLFIVLRLLIGRGSSIICFLVQVFYIIAIIVGRPYYKLIDYARFASIQFTLLFYLISRLALQYSTGSDISKDQFSKATCFVILVFIFIAILLTIASPVYEIYLTYKKKNQVTPLDGNIDNKLESSKKIEENEQIEDKQKIENNEQIKDKKISQKKQQQIVQEHKFHRNELKDMNQSQQLILKDYEEQNDYEDKQMQSPKRYQNNYPNRTHYGLFREQNTSLTTSINDLGSMRKLKTSKKKRSQYTKQ